MSPSTLGLSVSASGRMRHRGSRPLLPLLLLLPLPLLPLLLLLLLLLPLLPLLLLLLLLLPLLMLAQLGLVEMRTDASLLHAPFDDLPRSMEASEPLLTVLPPAAHDAATHDAAAQDAAAHDATVHGRRHAPAHASGYEASHRRRLVRVGAAGGAGGGGGGGMGVGECADGSVGTCGGEDAGRGCLKCGRVAESGSRGCTARDSLGRHLGHDLGAWGAHRRLHQSGGKRLPRLSAPSEAAKGATEAVAEAVTEGVAEGVAEGAVEGVAAGVAAAGVAVHLRRELCGQQARDRVV